MAFPCSSQKLPFVSALCIFVSVYNSRLPHQTTAVKLSFVLEWISACFGNLFCVRILCGIPFMLALTVPLQLIYFVGSSNSQHKEVIHMYVRSEAFTVAEADKIFSGNWPCQVLPGQLFYTCLCCCHIRIPTYHILP